MTLPRAEGLSLSPSGEVSSRLKPVKTVFHTVQPRPTCRIRTRALAEALGDRNGGPATDAESHSPVSRTSTAIGKMEPFILFERRPDTGQRTKSGNAAIVGVEESWFGIIGHDQTRLLDPLSRYSSSEPSDFQAGITNPSRRNISSMATFTGSSDLAVEVAPPATIR